MLDNKFKFDGQIVSMDLNSLNQEKGESYEISYTDKISNPHLGFLRNNTFDIWTKTFTAAAGGTIFVTGVMSVMEVEE